MLETAKEMYRYFLDEVRKERTVVITPPYWNRMIDPIVIKWIKTKLPLNDFNQKRIDDLEAIKVITDGRQQDPIPSLYTDGNSFRMPDGTYAIRYYPKYMHGISAQFANLAEDDIAVIGPDPEPSVVGGRIVPRETPRKFKDLVEGKILRSDVRGPNKRNTYSQQKADEYVYFDVKDGFIYVYSNSTIYTRLILEYYKYPSPIFYSEDSELNSNGDFGPTQNEEIMDMAVTHYLEKVSDQRIQAQPVIESQIPK